MSVNDYIMAHKETLNSHPFIHSLRSDHGSLGVLSFARDMTFFVLGFRDILELAKVRDPQSNAEKVLNIHCEEDANHWRWFLEDLSTLSRMSIVDTHDDLSEALLYSIWSEEQYSIRRHTYTVASLVINAADVDEKLAIIDCLEAAFAVFISALNASTMRSGLYEQLRYFGKSHHIEELGHSRDSHSDGLPFDQVRDSSYTDQLPSKIDAIFKGFNECFSLWHHSLKSHMPKKESEYNASSTV